MTYNPAKRAMALLLALIMTSSTLLSCSNTETGSETDGMESVKTAAEETEAETEPETTVTDQVREMYKDVSYDGATVRIAGYDSGTFFYTQIGSDFNEIFYEEQTGDVYVDAVYNRNIGTEDLLDIKIEAEFLPYDNHYATVAKALAKYVRSGDASVDMGVGSLAENITIAAQNNLYNIHDIDTIDTEAQWFDRNIIKHYSYRNKYLYAITGAHTIFDDYAVPTIYYDKTLLTQHNLNDPTELVIDGKWTMEAMVKMGEVVLNDVDGNGEMNTEIDTFGFFENAGILVHLMDATGNLLTGMSEDGIPYVSCLTPEYLDTAEFIYNLVIKNPSTAIEPTGGVGTAFINGNALFALELLAVVNRFRDREGDFGLLPVPKKDETQEQYVNQVNPVWCTSFAIPLSVQETERTGTVINVLNALSVDTVEDALYEQILGGKLFREEKSVVMLDYITKYKHYNWSVSEINSFGLTYEQNGTFVLASQAKSKEKSLNKALERLLKSFDKINGITE